MSTGLMSCVRENSPPLEMAGSESGAFSLPNNALDQQKRRRFHPLRNLRRIFRRRTLSGADTLARSVSSTPSSPSSSQSSSTPPTVIASVPAQNSLCSQGGRTLPVDVTTMSSAAYPPHLISLAGNRDVGSCGLTIGAPYKISTSASGGFFAKSIRGDGSDNAFHRGRDPQLPGQDMDENRDMLDYQRSLSEERLVDSDFTRDSLSQSHDSVFSESATASSLSLGLKAELFDVLRKRRNRPDASEEDLGLPRSPTTPQRKKQLTVNQGAEVSSLSLLSMASSELDDELTSNYGIGDKTSSSFSSSKYSQDTSRTSDEIDLDISAGNRLSHSAAHHKIAVRPKKKGPTRHRRPMEPTVLPSTPEVNEDSLKLLDVKDFFSEKPKTKSHSLPPGVNAKILDMHSTKTVTELVSTNIKRSKTETCSISSTCVAQTVRNEIEQTCSSSTSTLERKDEDGGFFKRFLHRSSKKIKKSLDEGDHAEEILPTISIEKYAEVAEEKSSMETKKEIASEIKSGLSALLNSMMVPSGHERPPIDSSATQKLNKPKSGPAARQRILPKDLTASPVPEIKLPELVNSSIQLIENEKEQTIPPIVAASAPEKTQIFKTNKTLQIETREKLTSMTKLSKSADETRIPRLKPTREEPAPTLLFTLEHFEKKERIQPKIIGLSPFLQKISRVESSTLEAPQQPVVKPRKSVEKSKSFRYYSEEADNTGDTGLKKRENMPSLPDLTTSRKSTELIDHLAITNIPRPESKPAPMGFEINDNNLIKLRRHEEPVPLTPGIYTKNIILSTTKPASVSSTHISSPSCNQNITEIEENIDKLVKAPFVTVLKSDALNEMKAISNVSTTMIRKSEIFETQEVTQMVQARTKMTKSASIEILNKMESKPNEKVKVEMTEQKVIVPTVVDKTVVNKTVVDKTVVEKTVVDKAVVDKTVIDKTVVEKKLTLELSELKSDNKPKEIPTSPTKAHRNSAIFEKPEDAQVPEFMKIQLNRVDSARPKSNVVLAKNVKETDERDLTRRFSNESVEITDTKPPLPPETAAAPANTKRISVPSVTKPQDEIVALKSPTRRVEEIIAVKSPTKKVDEENNILKNAENMQPVLAERRRSSTDEKPKYLKKIEAEKRKSIIDDNNRRSVDEDTGVILRKKSFSANNQSTNKEDTPELMKVFARRSLKIKDTDDVQSFDEPMERTNSLKKSINLDSDKENQSSSEEKLDKLPKIEITIQPKPSNGQLAQKNDDKNRSSSLVSGDIFRKPNPVAIINTTTAKPFVQPIRYSSVTTYRSMSTVFGEPKKGSTPLINSSTTTAATTTTTTATNLEQTNTTTVDENEQNNNNNINPNTTNIRHTIGSASPITSKLTRRDEGEFKGILQRRAEWEKRAKEASK